MNRAFCVSTGKFLVPITADSPRQAIKLALNKLERREGGIPCESMGTFVLICDELAQGSADRLIFMPTKDALKIAGLVREDELQFSNN